MTTWRDLPVLSYSRKCQVEIGKVKNKLIPIAAEPKVGASVKRNESNTAREGRGSGKMATLLYDLRPTCRQLFGCTHFYLVIFHFQITRVQLSVARKSLRMTVNEINGQEGKKTKLRCALTITPSVPLFLLRFRCSSVHDGIYLSKRPG